MPLTVVATVAALLLAGCGYERPRSPAEVEAAVEAYLAEQTDLRMGRMQVRADRIRYDGSRAVASVSIMSSDDPMAAMKMIYELEETQGGWMVVPPESVAGPAEEAIPGHGAVPGLPQGHPPVESQGGILPPGHPPVGAEER